MLVVEYIFMNCAATSPMPKEECLDYRLYVLIVAGVDLISQFLGLGKGICFRSVIEQLESKGFVVN
ncbi:Uncharacterised protein [uncultured archaeon]|nr:Uncharacterised protein [uncultured archaeon]